jgi:hypothetical protein
MTERYQLSPAWHVMDTQSRDSDGDWPRDMAAASSAADGERIVSALNSTGDAAAEEAQMDQGSDTARPEMPAFRAAQRAKLLLILGQDDGVREQMWCDGWAQVDGPWLHWLDDEDGRWVSWPYQHVRCVEWQYPVIEDDLKVEEA